MQPTNNGRTILLAEDDSEVRNYLELALRCQGYTVETADDGEEALSALEHMDDLSAVLLDIVMPRKDGLETLREIRRLNTAVPVIMISGASSPGNVVEAMKIGANDFLGKPVNPADLRKVLSHVIDARISTAPNSASSAPPAPVVAKNVFFGSNDAMVQIQRLLPQIAWSEAPALILGETGTGKEVLARELHAQSPRSRKPFLKLNCAALPSELVESELFGYEKGAFTGAFQRKAGMFELADEGTIFLDEIGDMEFKLQAKLLQVLQDHEFHRLGGKDVIRVDVRIIAATHQDLEQSIGENTFRKDLYYRLNVISLRLPALRERRDDIPQLAEFLLRKHATPGSSVSITPALREAFVAYDWPGNIRELENAVRKLLILRDPDFIARDLKERMNRNRTLATIDTRASGSGPDKTILEQVTKAKDDAEKTAIIAALDSTYWNRKKAALLLKIDYKALLYKMKKLGIDGRIATLPNDAAKPA